MKKACCKHDQPGKFFSHFCLVGLSSILLGCQLYRNNSRELFERLAPGRIVTSPVGSQAADIDILSCWTHPVAEDLPTLFQPDEDPGRLFYTIEESSDGLTREVCIAQNNSDTHAPYYQ